MTAIKPRLCPSPTIFAAHAHLCRLGTQPHGRGHSASFPGEGQAWPWTGPQLAQLQAGVYISFSNHAAFIFSEGMTKAMKNPFHISSAPHKPCFLYSAVNLEEATELCHPKKFEKAIKICRFQNLGKQSRQSTTTILIPFLSFFFLFQSELRCSLICWTPHPTIYDVNPVKKEPVSSLFAYKMLSKVRTWFIQAPKYHYKNKTNTNNTSSQWHQLLCLTLPFGESTLGKR